MSPWTPQLSPREAWKGASTVGALSPFQGWVDISTGIQGLAPPGYSLSPFQGWPVRVTTVLNLLVRSPQPPEAHASWWPPKKWLMMERMKVHATRYQAARGALSPRPLPAA